MRTNIKKWLVILLVTACSSLLGNNSTYAEYKPYENIGSINPFISELENKYFRITTENGKKNMSLITGYFGKPSEQQWWRESYANPCVNNVARLARPEAATEIIGTNKILALLDCPAANDGGAESIVAMFDSSNANTPVCFSQIDLMDKAEYYYWGGISSVEVRKLSENNFIVIPVLSGGDAGDSWTSHVFLHMDNKCNLTLLSRFYAGMYYETDDSGQCGGEKDSYKFIGDSTVELKRVNIVCTKKGERSKLLMKKSLDLKILLHKPALRTIEPK